MKVDGSGEPEWDKTYGGSKWDEAESIVPDSEGGYVVVGQTESTGEGLHDAWVFRIDASGGLVWERTYGEDGDDWLSSIQRTSDGGYIAAGGKESLFSDSPAA